MNAPDLTRKVEPSRAEILERKVERLNEVLDFAFAELLWISEYPNRIEGAAGNALALAERARASLIELEAPAERGKRQKVGSEG